MNTLQPMSPPFTEQQKARWERIRSGGTFWFFFRFALVVPLVVFAVIDLLPHYFGWFGARWLGIGDELWRFFFGQFAVALLLSCLFWRSGEKRYKATLLVGSSGPEWK